MGGDQPVENKEKNTNQTVTSIGSSWIICRSKSHIGRIYYFNTLTGEAAWNLSDPEIEKARIKTNYLQSQTGTEFESCPEPKEPPMDLHPGSNTGKQQSAQMYHTSRVYNKQIINNQFSKQTLAPFTHCAICNTHVPQTTIDTLGVIKPVPHNCSQNVWTVPPSHQIVIAPSTSASFLNQVQGTSDVGYSNLEPNVRVQNTSLSLSRRFNQMQPNLNKHVLNNHRRGGLPFNKNFNQKIDLRQKLSARKSYNWNNGFNNVQYPDRESIENNNKTFIQIIKPEMEAITPSEADHKWLQENLSVQGTQLVLNIRPLKEIVTVSERLCWYIVADTNVLLDHINLIEVIVNSDEQCQLMVPDYVMAELQNTSRLGDTLLMSRAHHVLQILSQLFATGCAVLGRNPVNDVNNDQIFHFCTKLSEQDHNVVLVSNNIRLEKYRNTSNIPMLTIPELKKVLSGDELSHVRRKVLCPLNAIKITVPNDGIKNTKLVSFSAKTHDNNKTQAIDTLFGTSAGNMPKEKYEISETNNATYNFKSNAKDVGIQTDFVHIIDKVPQKIDKSTITENTLTGFNTKIQLKRNLSYQGVVDTNEEKKQFKWRRRKRIESAPQKPTTDEKSVGCDPILHNEGIKFDQPSNFKNINNGISDHQSTCNDETNDSSETGSSCYVHKNVVDRIVIEETSTSGIISNSASIIDSESMSSIKPDDRSFIQNLNEKTDNCKCAMFEVESPAMAEYLKMRCDEWISRFVQIMEEVLTQTLQLDPPFFNRTLPPPWSIHEATECIKKKFGNDNDVIDAANKLTGLLFKISDGRGKIKTELKPEEFMEMYSYGVYLVDSLQTVLSSSEDLQTAADSLAKLLNDIVDPNLDTGHVDSFMETSNVSGANVTQLTTKDVNSPTKINKDELKVTETSISPKSVALSDTRKYNLRSHQSKPDEEKENEEVHEKPVKFIRNIDTKFSFLSCLNLQKNKESDIQKLCLFDNKTSSLEPRNSNSNEEMQNKEPKNEPKIIRNFTKCLEFERRLQSKNDQFDTLDHNQDLEEGELDEYDCYDDDYNYKYDYFENEDFEGFEVNESTLGKNSNDIYNRLFGKFINELQNAFLEVHSFCEKTRDELKSVPAITSGRKIEICEKAKKARLHMNILCKSLNGILCRENTNCQNNLQTILSEAGIHLDGTKFDEYRNMISKYSSQANILLDAVDLVIQTMA